MHLLSDILTYIRRIVKSPSDAVLSDSLLIDYVNRFWLSDVDARMQLFDLKTKYQFQTTPGVDQYNTPLYSVQTGSTASPLNPSIGMFPVYQGFLGPAYINGVSVPFHTQKERFFNWFPNIVQNLTVVAVSDGRVGPYTIQLPILSPPSPPNPPLQGLLRGHIDITGIITLGNNVDPPLQDTVTAPLAISSVPTTSVESRVYLTSIDSTGANVIVADSGQFLSGNVNYGLLMQPGQAPYGNSTLAGGYDISNNTINYFTGTINVQFPVTIPPGNNINAQVYYFQSGLPRGILYYNNVLTLRMPPDRQYLVELEAYLTPAAFFDTEAAIPFGYMAEYIARGAARKIMSDTYDTEQFSFYEPLFREQELLVWKRSQRQWTSTRTETIYSQGMNGLGYGSNNMGTGGGL